MKICLALARRCESRQEHVMPAAIIIANREINERTGQEEIIASHGIDLATDHEFQVPQIDPRFLGATFDQEYGEYVLAYRR